MDIVKRLSRGNEYVAVLIKDGGEEYPVFLESLHNTVLLDQLIADGWQLCGLPYDLRKDGAKLVNLPIEEFNPTIGEEQDMFDMLGEKLSMEELKSRMTEATVEFIETPPSEYTIFTREDFLKYLETADNIKLDTDFLPINYFVHPNALFSVEEFTGGCFTKYLDIMARRRAMSYTKFNMLLSWAFEKKLNPNFECIDLLDFYYQWGIDGLHMPVVTKRREPRYRVLDAGNVTMEMLHNQYIYRQEIGLVDKYGTILLPEASKKLKWEPKIRNQQVYEENYSSLKDNNTRVVEVQCRASEDSTILEGLKINVQYDSNLIMVGGLRIPNIYVYPNDSSNRPISSQYWNPSNYTKLNTICNLRALAQAAIEKCITPSNATSFKALTMSGCSPYSALLYYVKNAKLDEGVPDPTTGKMVTNEDGMPVISVYDIDKYISGEDLDEEKFDVLDSFVKGIANIGHTYEGIRAEAEYSAESMFSELYAAHFVLDIPLDTIYQKITNIGEEEHIVFEGQGYQHIIDLPKLRLRINGYNCDLEDYRDESLSDAIEYVYIKTAAREMGTKEAPRHVAFECLTLFRDTRSNSLLSTIKDMFLSRIEDNVIGTQAQAEFKKLADMFAAQRFFEAALKGTITFPKAVNGEVVKLSAQEQNLYRSMLNSNIESTVIYCNTNVEIDGTFRRYCVNAYVTPEYIIPKTNYTIPESNFLVLWRDYSSNPEVKATLIERGLIPQDHIAWDNRYYTQKLCFVNMLSNLTLDFYNENAESYRNTVAETEEFLSAPHPIEYLNPGLYKEDQDDMSSSSTTLRQGLPRYNVGIHRNITLEDFRQILSIDQIDESNAMGIKLFKGFDAEDFYLVKDVLRLIIPNGDKNITVYPPMKIYTKDNGISDYTVIAQLAKTNQYRIANIRGRKYILRDMKGKYWEVTI